MAKKIFLSYSRKDKDFAEKIATNLEKNGYVVWWDLTDIEGGDRWAKEIQEGITKSQIMAIIVSPNSIASEWVEKEFIFASKKGLKIVPLLYEHCELPIWLLNLQYIDLIGVNYGHNFKQVLEALEKYGRRAGDLKVDSPKLVKRITHASPYWLLMIITLLIILVGALLNPFAPAPLPTPTPSNTTTQTPTETHTLTPTNTNTPFPTNTDRATASPTDAGEETAIPSQTESPSPTPSETPTQEELASVIRDNSGAEMLLVDKGTFLMGNNKSDADEAPVHILMMDDFYIDKYEVTNADYTNCVDSQNCTLPKNTTFYLSALYSNHPVVFVSWEMANDYCAWRDARLPTEAEWEKAARGTNHFTYPWGNTFDGNALNFCDAECTNSWANKSYRDRYTMTAPIGLYPDGMSAYNVFDMAGNATEWVADWYAADYYLNSPNANPTGPESGVYRVLRGGSWFDRNLDVRTFTRAHLRPNVAYNYTGFRCARDAEK